MTMILCEAMLHEAILCLPHIVKQSENLLVAYHFTSFFCSLQVGSGHYSLCLTCCGLFQVVSCSLQVISRLFFCLLQVFSSPYRSFHVASCSCGSFQVISCLLQVISGHFLPVVGRFRFLARCRTLQVVSCSLQVVAGHSRLFLACCRSLQVIPCFSKYCLVVCQCVFGTHSQQPAKTGM